MTSIIQPISLGYLVTWRSSFRQYKGVVISIDYEDDNNSNSVDSCEVLVIYEIDDREIYTLPRRSYRISLVRPAVKEYLDIILQNYITSQYETIITPSVKYEVIKEALERIDERNDIPMTIAKSRAIHEVQSEYESHFTENPLISHQRRNSTSSTIDGNDLEIGFDSQLRLEEKVDEVVDQENEKVGEEEDEDDEDDDENENQKEEDEDESEDSNSNEDDDEDSSEDNSDSDDEKESDGSPYYDHIRVKVFVAHANETRGFSVTTKKGFKVIRNQLSKDYDDCDLSLYYLDSDGDKIHIAAKSDFEYAIRSLKKRKNKSSSSSLLLSARPRESKSGSPTLSSTSPKSDQQLSTPESSQKPILRLTAVLNKSMNRPITSPVNPKKSSKSKISKEVSKKSSNCKHTGEKNSRHMEEDNEIIWQRGELIGSGSFGRVYSGIDLKTGNKIAVKEINISLGQSERHKAFEQAISIQREVRVLSTLDHRNIVKYYGTEYLDDVIRIFLELATNGSIKDFIHEFGGLAESILRRYTHDIVSGLEYLHVHGIIHRDVKPSNLLVFNGIIKLADFGCAAFSPLDANGFVTSYSAHGTMAGTTIYMSPEIMQLGNSPSPIKPTQVNDVNNNNKDNISNSNNNSDDDLHLEIPSTMSFVSGYGRKTDIWSLGITLVEMAVGKAPFRNAAAAIYSVCVIREYPSFPSSMSNEAKDFLSRCLVENSKDRASADELLGHPFLTSQFQSPMVRTNPGDRASSLIYSSTSVSILPPHISKTASSAKTTTTTATRTKSVSKVDNLVADAKHGMDNIDVNGFENDSFDDEDKNSSNYYNDNQHILQQYSDAKEYNRHHGTSYVPTATTAAATAAFTNAVITTTTTNAAVTYDQTMGELSSPHRTRDTDEDMMFFTAIGKQNDPIVRSNDRNSRNSSSSDKLISEIPTVSMDGDSQGNENTIGSSNLTSLSNIRARSERFRHDREDRAEVDTQLSIQTLTGVITGRSSIRQSRDFSS